MKLSVFERLLILNIFAEYKSNIINAKIVKNLIDMVGFDEEEHEKLSICFDDGKVHWNSEGDIDKDFEIGTKTKSVVAEELEVLNKKELIKLEHISLYDKFVSEE